jgi:hypothetical protein
MRILGRKAWFLAAGSVVLATACASEVKTRDDDDGGGAGGAGTGSGVGTGTTGTGGTGTGTGTGTTGTGGTGTGTGTTGTGGTGTGTATGTGGAGTGTATGTGTGTGGSGGTGTGGTGTGGAGGSTGSDAGATCPKPPAKGGASTSIDDLEDKNAQILVADNRDGYWFVDAAPGSVVTPPKGMFATEAGGPPGSTQAVHVSGTVTGYGGSVGLKFMSGTIPCAYDISAFSGVTFWAKSNGGPVTFSLNLTSTTPADQGGDGSCSGTAAMQCYDDYTKDITASLGADWKQVTVNFNATDLKQGGWGAKVPLDMTKGFGLQVKFPPPTPDAGLNVDFWLDNIAFIGGTGGTPDSGGTGGTPDSGGSTPDAPGPAVDVRESGAADASGQ